MLQDSRPAPSVWSPLGDRAILVEYSDADPAAANARARNDRSRIAALSASEVEDLIPAARSLLIVLAPGADPGPKLLRILRTPEATPPAPAAMPALHTISIHYGGEAGPDLAELARVHDISPDEIVRRHTAAEYTVGFLGFCPGFAYLLGLPPKLSTPRKATPRSRVPAGSVAIGGPYTGIYPSETPGGWHLIGRADATLFDPLRNPPALFAPGDRVRFIPQ